MAAYIGSKLKIAEMVVGLLQSLGKIIKKLFYTLLHKTENQ
jgi:hypothetical protein